jgi:hypothetical protein
MHISTNIRENRKATPLGECTGEYAVGVMYGYRPRRFDPSDYFQWLHCSYRNRQYASK